MLTALVYRGLSISNPSSSPPHHQEQGVPNQKYSENGRFQGASQFAKKTMRQNLPKFQHNMVVENNTITPHTPSDTEKELLIQKQTDECRLQYLEAPMRYQAMLHLVNWLEEVNSWN